MLFVGMLTYLEQKKNTCLNNILFRNVFI
jgi:hypothetical protein